MPQTTTSPAAAVGPDGDLEPPSVLVLTKDEEVNIAGCLRRLDFSDDIVVLDSYSNDRTVEIARQFPNVRVIQRKFDTWSKHSNWAVTNIEFKHPWLYYSDADERVPAELRDEILRVINDAGKPYNAYRLRYKNMFLGKWIRRGGLYPVWIIRLFKPDRIRYEDREVNAHPIVDGEMGELKEHFIHYSFNKGLVPWFHKHNSYSEMESHEAFQVFRDSFKDQLKRVFSKQHRAVRRRAIKNLSFYLPWRGLVRFVYMYILKLGFLDGRAGLTYAAMISMYEYWIELKVIEGRSSWRQKTDEMASKMLEEPGKASSAAPSDPPWPCRDGDPDRPLIEFMIPTLNEAAHIRQTVENARQVGPVFVLDSLSTDGTQEIARDAGATVVEHPFENYSKQKNWGLDNLPFKGEWVFILDADERVTPALRDELIKVVQSDTGIEGYFINRVVIFMGRPIRHGGLYPSWNLRFFRRGRCRYEDRAVHEHMVCDGETSYLKNEMLHIRRETITEYLRKHIYYADLESDEWVKMKLGQSTGAEARKLFPNPLKFRQWLRRRVWPKTPLRPMWRFLYMYIVRLGVLDGRAGWHLALLMASYEYMISILYRDKMYHLRQRKDAGEPAGAPGTAEPSAAAGAAPRPEAEAEAEARPAGRTTEPV